jgi:hypothetical protein
MPVTAVAHGLQVSSRRKRLMSRNGEGRPMRRLVVTLLVAAAILLGAASAAVAHEPPGCAIAHAAAANAAPTAHERICSAV